MNNPLSGNILIVDDTPANLRLLKELLTGSGFKVRPATSGEVAIRSALLSPPDLILLDIRMPGMDGYEVCQRLKADPSTQAIPVIFISAMNDLSDRLRGFELGAVDYITKPFEREEVLLRVRTHLELHHMRNSLTTMVAERTRQLSDTVRALKTLSGVNQSLLHASGEDDLLQRICRVLHEVGGFPLAWIGFLREDGTGLRVMAQRGDAAGLVEGLAASADDNPAQRAMSGGDPVQCPDLAASCGFGELTAALLGQGYRSAVALPLRHEGRTYGAISLFRAHSGEFSGGELALLKELTEDLAFGLQHLRTEAAHRLAEQQRLEQSLRLSRSLEQTIQAVALTVEKRDPYTAGHQFRVADLAGAIARELEWADQAILGLRMSAMIHDLGKIYVPAEILSRPGRLSAAEWAIVQTHSEVGHDIIQGVEFPWPVAEIILQHHERMDGSGYPRGLKAGEILPEARIIAVADVVDAMSSHRPYRPALGIAAALDEISDNPAYDAAVVAACETLFNRKDYHLPAAAVGEMATTDIANDRRPSSPRGK